MAPLYLLGAVKDFVLSRAWSLPLTGLVLLAVIAYALVKIIIPWYYPKAIRRRAKYRGATRAGVPHGRGRLEFPDESCYDGEFYKGKFHGHGLMKYKSVQDPLGLNIELALAPAGGVPLDRDQQERAQMQSTTTDGHRADGKSTADATHDNESELSEAEHEETVSVGGSTTSAGSFATSVSLASSLSLSIFPPALSGSRSSSPTPSTTDFSGSVRAVTSQIMQALSLKFGGAATVQTHDINRRLLNHSRELTVAATEKKPANSQRSTIKKRTRQSRGQNKAGRAYSGRVHPDIAVLPLEVRKILLALNDTSVTCMGMFKNGLRHGPASMVFNFLNLEGNACVSTACKGVRFEGTFENGLIEGQGVVLIDGLDEICAQHQTSEPVSSSVDGVRRPWWLTGRRDKGAADIDVLPAHADHSVGFDVPEGDDLAEIEPNLIRRSLISAHRTVTTTSLKSMSRDDSHFAYYSRGISFSIDESGDEWNQSGMDASEGSRAELDSGMATANYGRNSTAKPPHHGGVIYRDDDTPALVGATTELASVEPSNLRSRVRRGEASLEGAALPLTRVRSDNEVYTAAEDDGVSPVAKTKQGVSTSQHRLVGFRGYWRAGELCHSIPLSPIFVDVPEAGTLCLDRSRPKKLPALPEKAAIDASESHTERDSSEHLVSNEVLESPPVQSSQPHAVTLELQRTSKSKKPRPQVGPLANVISSDHPSSESSTLTGTATSESRRPSNELSTDEPDSVCPSLGSLGPEAPNTNNSSHSSHPDAEKDRGQDSRPPELQRSSVETDLPQTTQLGTTAQSADSRYQSKAKEPTPQAHAGDMTLARQIKPAFVRAKVKDDTALGNLIAQGYSAAPNGVILSLAGQSPQSMPSSAVDPEGSGGSSSPPLQSPLIPAVPSDSPVLITHVNLATTSPAEDATSGRSESQENGQTQPMPDNADLSFSASTSLNQTQFESIQPVAPAAIQSMGKQPATWHPCPPPQPTSSTSGPSQSYNSLQYFIPQPQRQTSIIYDQPGGQHFVPLMAQQPPHAFYARSFQQQIPPQQDHDEHQAVGSMYLQQGYSLQSYPDASHHHQHITSQRQAYSQAYYQQAQNVQHHLMRVAQPPQGLSQFPSQPAFVNRGAPKRTLSSPGRSVKPPTQSPVPVAMAQPFLQFPMQALTSGPGGTVVFAPHPSLVQGIHPFPAQMMSRGSSRQTPPMGFSPPHFGSTTMGPLSSTAQPPLPLSSVSLLPSPGLPHPSTPSLPSLHMKPTHMAMTQQIQPQQHHSVPQQSAQPQSTHQQPGQHQPAHCQLTQSQQPTQQQSTQQQSTQQQSTQQQCTQQQCAQQPCAQQPSTQHQLQSQQLTQQQSTQQSTQHQLASHQSPSERKKGGSKSTQLKSTSPVQGHQTGRNASDNAVDAASAKLTLLPWDTECKSLSIFGYSDKVSKALKGLVLFSSCLPEIDKSEGPSLLSMVLMQSQLDVKLQCPPVRPPDVAKSLRNQTHDPSLERELKHLILQSRNHGSRAAPFRSKAAASIRKLARSIWPTAEVIAHGSARTGTELVGSDLDLVVVLCKTGTIYVGSTPVSPSATLTNRAHSQKSANSVSLIRNTNAEQIAHFSHREAVSILASALRQAECGLSNDTNSPDKWITQITVITSAAVPVIRITGKFVGSDGGIDGGVQTEGFEFKGDIAVVADPSKLLRIAGNPVLIPRSVSRGQTSCHEDVLQLELPPLESIEGGADSRTTLHQSSTSSTVPSDQHFPPQTTLASAWNTGPLATQLCADIQASLPNALEVAIIVKYILNEVNLASAYTGGLSSYCVIVMSAAFVRAMHAFGSDIGLSSDLPLDTLVLGFLDFYGHHFDPSSLIVALQSPTGYLAHSQLTSDHVASSAGASPSVTPLRVLSILDPLDSSNNLAISCFQFIRIQSIFRHIVKTIQSTLQPYSTTSSHGTITGRTTASLANILKEMSAHRQACDK